MPPGSAFVTSALASEHAKGSRNFTRETEGFSVSVCERRSGHARQSVSCTGLLRHVDGVTAAVSVENLLDELQNKEWCARLPSFVSFGSLAIPGRASLPHKKSLVLSAAQ